MLPVGRYLGTMRSMPPTKQDQLPRGAYLPAAKNPVTLPARAPPSLMPPDTALLISQARCHLPRAHKCGVWALSLGNGVQKGEAMKAKFTKVRRKFQRQSRQKETTAGAFPE